jgi:anti-sigma regulatory factor (Ser/Thr protein kinase)
LARDFLEVHVSASPARDSLELITSELVTNAFTHGIGEIHISLESGPQSKWTVRVSSDFDASAGPPDLGVQKVRDDLAENGRGLQVVGAVSSQWGWDTAGPTLVVWATISQ